MIEEVSDALVSRDGAVVLSMGQQPTVRALAARFRSREADRFHPGS
jgi:hypothetical protein